MKQFSVLSLLVILFLTGCTGDRDRLQVDVSRIVMPPVKIHRYDLELFAVNKDQLPAELERLRPEYRFFLDTDLKDASKLSAMRQYLENPGNQEFFVAVKKRYNDLSRIEMQLSDAFRHMAWYIPEFKPPRVYAYISGGDYDFPVQFADSVLLVGLDNYLGEGFAPYSGDGLPAYRIARMTEDQIVPDCIRVLLKNYFPSQVPGNTLLDQIVDAGKRLYLLDAMLPGGEMRLKIGYTELQYNWMVRNERHVWAAMIANRMLYSTDGQLIRSFLADGPFSADFTRESPPRLGEWIGWQIVSQYMDKEPGTTLNLLMNEHDAQKILSRSGYKPVD